MPSVREMFPSKFLQPEDLEPGKPTVVTIRDVYAEAFKRNTSGDAEAEWTIRFAEFRKPMKLKAINARTIADVLGTDRTEDWIDETVGIFPTQVQVHGKLIPVINVDILKPQSRPALTGSKVDKTPIGEAAATRFAEHIKRAGGTFDLFLAWLKQNHPDGLALAFGVAIPDLPRALVPAMKEYLDSIAGKTEVIDAGTGEVIEPRSPTYHAPDMVPRDPAQIPGVSRGMPPASRPPANSVPDDDIPF